MFNIYIQRIADLHGVTHTRAAYEQAIERLPEKHARQMCLRFADLERKLGEVDRARAVYAYAAQMCDPRVGVPFQLPVERLLRNPIWFLLFFS